MSPKRRRRSDIFRAALLIFSAASCAQADACGKSCSSCQSKANDTANDAASCDCGGNPGASGYDDGPWYDDYGGDGTPQPTCQYPLASCDGTPEDSNGCETNLSNKWTCGHCLRDCGTDECLEGDDGYFCQATIHEDTATSDYIGVAADETLLAWRTETTTIVASTITGEPIDLATPLADHVVYDGNVYGISPAGDIVHFVFPATMAQVLVPGPSDAHMLRVANGFVYWVQTEGLVRAPLAGGSTEPLLTEETYEIADFEVDYNALWVAGFSNDVPRFYRVGIPSGTAYEIKETGGTSLDSTVDVEVTETFVYLGRENRLFSVDKDNYGVASDLGSLPEHRDQMIAAGEWIYVREADRLLAVAPEPNVTLELFVHQGTITSMAVARGRVYFTTPGALSSVAW